MAKQTKLTVTTDVGTFTRKTVRTYSHIVVVKGTRKEVLERHRLGSIAHDRRLANEYEQTIATGISRTDRVPAHRESTARWIADGSYAKWVAQYRASADALEAAGPVTADEGDAFHVLGWTGRLDLALKLAGTDEATRYRHVRIYAIDGTQVR